MAATPELDPFSEGINDVYTIFIGIVLVMLPVFIIAFYLYHFNKLKDDKFE